jgi:oxalate decarboxylase
MKLLNNLTLALLVVVGTTRASILKRAAQFIQGQPIDADGKGALILGMVSSTSLCEQTNMTAGGTNKALDLQNPDNLGAQSTDNGVVPNLKWSFSDSKVRIFNGGWVREQVITDLPSSHDIAAAQQHLRKGALRELHWHRVAEWGFVYNGSIIVAAVDENGKHEVSKLNVGDIWYFPKGVAHTIQGVADENEYLLVFDDGDFDKVG